jgi:hypothetical protein
LRREGVDVLFAPMEHEMYPTPQVYRVQPPPLAEELEGASRPGFFHGVCTVVLKLFHLVQPDVAVFGKKDRQQLKIVRGMVQQFNMRIQVVPAETVRAPTVSRCRRATTTCRRRARRSADLYRVLRSIADEIAGGRTDYANLEPRAPGTRAARMEGRLRRGPPRPRAAHPAPRGLRPPEPADRARRGDAREHAAHRQRRRVQERRRRLGPENRVRDDFRDHIK